MFWAGFLCIRRLLVYYTALRVYWTIRSTRRATRGLDDQDSRSVQLWSACHRRCARRLLRSMLHLRGLWLKAGQYISTRADAVPREYVDELVQLQDSVPSSRPERIRRRIETELAMNASGGGGGGGGGLSRRMEELFAAVDISNPLGCASIAQVHRAVLASTQEPVVIKVRHPGVKRLILQDLENLRVIFDWVAYYEPNFDWRELVREWSARVREELDFTLEAENLRRVRASLLRSGMLGTEVLVPRVIDGLVTEKVLVMEYMEGVRITAVRPKVTAEAEESSTAALVLDQDACEQVMMRTSRAFAHQMFVDGEFNGDPHGGNILVQRVGDGGNEYKPVLLDFGLVVRLSEPMRRGLARMMFAASDGDTYMLLQSFTEMGMHFPGTREATADHAEASARGSGGGDDDASFDPTRSMEVVQFLFRSTAPMDEAREEQAAYFRRQDRRARTRRQQPRTEPRRPPPNRRPSDMPSNVIPGAIMFMMRVVGLLRGLASTLAVRHAFLPVFREYALRSLPPRDALSVPRGPPRSLTDKVYALLHSMGHRVVGMQVAAYHRHKLVADVAYGEIAPYDWRPAAERRVTPKTLFSSFSTTKGVTAMLVARALHRTQQLARSFPKNAPPPWKPVQYETPVHEIWPEFGTSEWKRQCTVGHVMSHRAGLQHAIPPSFSMQNALQWQRMVEEMAAAEPSSPPGERAVYHYITFGWLAGAIAEHCWVDAEREQFRSLQAQLGELKREYGIEADEAYIGLPLRPATAAAGGEPFDATDQPPVDVSRLAVLNKFGAHVFAEDLISGKDVAEPEPRDAATQNGEREAFDSDAVSDATTSSAATTAVGPLSIFERIAQDDKERQELNAVREMLVRNKLFWVLEPCFFNHPTVRRAILPAANGHFTARALARMYDASMQQPWWRAAIRRVPGGEWSIGGFQVYGDGVVVGHAGMGGSIALAVPRANLAIAITVNRLELSRMTGSDVDRHRLSVAEEVVELVAREVGIRQRLFRRR